MRHLISVLILLLAISAYAQSSLTGTVFNDANGNGTRDANEAGVAGVSVSDQVNVVTTDASGNYRIPTAAGYGIVMISVPSGYKAVHSFWKPRSETSTTVDFALEKINQPTEFTFLQASDTHISEKSLDRMVKFKNAVKTASPDLVLITGDLVRDALRVSEKEATGYYELFKKEISTLDAPVWLVPGNHEIFGIERHLSLVSAKHPLYGRAMYRHYFGPDYYSFNYGGVHFIALNSLEFDDLYYYGRIDSVQLEWLKRDVATLSKSTPIVTFQHVPFYSGGLSLQPYEEEGLGRSLETGKGGKQFRHVVSNAAAVFTILQGYNYPLALAGHYHYQQKFTMEGVGTRFEQTAAVIGPAQEGVFNMPSGVTLYRVKDGKIDQGRFIPLD